MLESQELINFKTNIDKLSVLELQKILTLVYSKLSQNDRKQTLTRLNNQQLKGIPFELVEDEDITEMGL